MRRPLSAVAAILIGCSAGDAEPPTGQRQLIPPRPADERAVTEGSARADQLSRLARRLGRRDLSWLDSRDERHLVGAPKPPAPETDQHPLYEAFLWSERTDAVTPLAASVRAALLEPAAVLIVDERGVLWRKDEHGSQRLTDRVLGLPARRPSGDLVVSRAGAEPGQSELTWLRADGSAQVLAPAAGPDDLPIALPDGRVAFVSGRTTVTSLWWVAPETGELRQLTNRGLAAGRPLVGFVPPPARAAAVQTGALLYDDGSGRQWRVDVETGEARRLESGLRGKGAR